MNLFMSFKGQCRLTIENPPPRVSSMNHFFLKEDLILRTFVANVKALSLKGDRLKNKYCKTLKNHIFLLD
jgi:hypothetical protein